MDRQAIEDLQQRCRGLKVLYVEDNDLARISTKDILDDFFDSIEVAVDGVDGLEKFKQHSFDLVITDINMPHMNGIDMIAKIKQLASDTPILVISAYNESNYFLETIKLGIEGYLLKPIDIEQFLMIISKTVEKIELVRENIEYRQQLEQKVKHQIEQLLQKDQIITQKSKLAVMGEMVDAIAHQFKQPLSIIQLQAQQLQYAFENDDIDKEVIHDSTEGTMQQVQHLVETISQFREFLRPDTKIESIDIETLLSSVLLLVQDELKQNRIDVSLHGDLSSCINVIAGEFKHVIINLLNNTKDAFNAQKIQDGKKIEITVSKQPTQTQICVADNAGGIPQSIINDIFKPNVSSKNHKHSSGIGLYICNMIIKKVGGSIEAKNTDNGAVFTITLPNAN